MTEASSSFWAECRQRHADLRATQDKPLRQRDAAAALKVSEGKLLSAYVGETTGTTVIRLQNNFIEIMESVPTFGHVMALTRNHAIVHERQGTYGNMSHKGQVGLALGKDIDLRIFYREWASAFAVTDDSPRGQLKSLQFYDAHGEAIHKIYLREMSNVAAYNDLVGKWASPEQVPGLTVTTRPPADVELPDEAIDVEGFHQAWEGMQDTHDFFGMIKKYKLSRPQALRLGPTHRVHAVAPSTLQTLLEHTAAHAVPIMVFVGNPGMLQIHSGPVVNIKMMDINNQTWLNVLDPDFNLHLRADLVDSAYIVEKPTSDGVVTSFEIYDNTGFNIAMFFGARKPGIPELQSWRDALATVPRLRKDEST